MVLMVLVTISRSSRWLEMAVTGHQCNYKCHDDSRDHSVTFNPLEHNNLCDCQCQKWLLLTILPARIRALDAPSHGNCKKFSVSPSHKATSRSHYTMINTTQSNAQSAHNSRNRQTNARIKQTMQLKLPENFTICILYGYLDSKESILQMKDYIWPNVSNNPNNVRIAKLNCLVLQFEYFTCPPWGLRQGFANLQGSYHWKSKYSGKYCFYECDCNEGMEEKIKQVATSSGHFFHFKTKNALLADWVLPI